MQRLLSNGADIISYSNKCVSPIDIACEYGHDNIAQLLQSRGADINVCSNHKTSSILIAFNLWIRKRGFATP